MDAVPEGRILGMIVIDLEQRSRTNELNLLSSRRAWGPLKGVPVGRNQNPVDGFPTRALWQ